MHMASQYVTALSCALLLKLSVAEIYMLVIDQSCRSSCVGETLIYCEGWKNFILCYKNLTVNKFVEGSRRRNNACQLSTFDIFRKNSRVM